MASNKSQRQTLTLASSAPTQQAQAQQSQSPPDPDYIILASQLATIRNGLDVSFALVDLVYKRTGNGDWKNARDALIAARDAAAAVE